MKRPVAFLLTLTLCVTVASAAMIATPSSITSEPDGAEIYSNNKYVGTTPWNGYLKKTKPFVLEIRKKCFATAKHETFIQFGEKINFVLQPDTTDPECKHKPAAPPPGNPPASSKSELQTVYENIVLPPAPEKKLFVAVMDMKGVGGADMEKTAAALSDTLRTEFVSTGYYKVCDRANIDTIMKEIGFQQSGCTSSECVVQVGRTLGVEKMITGSISKLGDTYSISLQVIDVATALVEKSISERASCKEGDLFFLVGIAVKKLIVAK